MPLTNFGYKKIHIFVGHLIEKTFIQSHPTLDSTNSISQNIRLNLNMMF